MKRSPHVRILAVLMWSLLLVVPAFAQSDGWNFTSFAVPNANDTYPVGINKEGVIIGAYNSLFGPGFIREPSGRIILLSFNPVGINDEGTVVGYETYGDTHVSVRYKDGSVTTFEVPGAVSVYPSGINDRGVIVGGYETRLASGDCAPVCPLGFFGFLRYSDGRIVKFDPMESNFTTPGNQFDETFAAINHGGAVFGAVNRYDNGVVYAFVREPDGRIIKFNPPGCSDWAIKYGYPASWENIFPRAINDSGEVVGNCGAPNVAADYAFLRDRNGVITPIDIPGSALTEIVDINREGTILGTSYSTFAAWTDDNAQFFVRYRDGKIVSVDLPNTFTIPAAAAINNFDTIIGTYFDTIQVSPPVIYVYGFVVEHRWH